MLSHHPDLRLVWYALEWTIRVVAIGVVPLRRSPAATASWLLLIFFLPVVGVVAYLAVGRPDYPPDRKRRWRALIPFFEHEARRLHAVAEVEVGDVALFSENLGRLPAVGGNDVELIDDYDVCVSRLIADIEAARERIDILVYIFADDDVGRRVAGALGGAVARGVACRVMFDPVGSHAWRRGTWRLLKEAGVETRESLPVRLLRRRSRADMRNHRKLFVIDGAIGYAGSQNLVAKDFRPGVVNRELVARVTGPVVAEMASIVSADWAIEDDGVPSPSSVAVPSASGGARLQLLPSGAAFRLEGFETLLVWQIHQARERVVLTTPYFVPDEDVIGALRTAAARGVVVDLIVSAVVDQRIVHLAQCSYFDELLSAGVRIHRFRNFLLHAKNVSIDGTLGIVGSSNVDLRSFQLNEEVSLLLLDASEVTRLVEIQNGYVAGSDLIDASIWRSRPKSLRLLENVARVMSPLL